MWNFKRRWRSSDSWSSTKLPLAILLPPARKQGSWRERNTKPVYYCFVQMFYGGSAVRRNLRCTRYTKARVPLKCCKVFNIFGSVRVAPRRLKSSSSHHWPNCLQRWIRNWGVKSRTSCFGSFVNIYPDRGDNKNSGSSIGYRILFYIQFTTPQMIIESCVFKEIFIFGYNLLDN